MSKDHLVRPSQWTDERGKNFMNKSTGFFGEPGVALGDLTNMVLGGTGTAGVLWNMEGAAFWVHFASNRVWFIASCFAMIRSIQRHFSILLPEKLRFCENHTPRVYASDLAQFPVKGKNSPT